MADTLRLGLVQMTSGADHAGNIAQAEALVAEAAREGCQMVAFPEVAGLMNRKIAEERSKISDEARDPYIGACCRLAKAHSLWIHTGSTPIIAAGSARFLNHANLIDPSGEIRARYDKIHLFDIFPEGGKPIQESKRYAPGARAVLAQTPWGKMGMSICYDLRFAHLYRAYAKAGAAALFIPSAFTVPTGRAHWEVLLRARAIECGAFVIAAAQVGAHEDGRVTYGHAMVVDPWGKVLVDMETRTGVAPVDLDLGAVAKARAQIPALAHDRPFDPA